MHPTTTAAVLLADDTWRWHGGGWTPWFLFFPFLWLVLLGVVLVAVRRGRGRRFGPPWQGGPGGPFGGPPWAAGRGAQAGPLQVLGERFARGEIEAEEYRARRAVLTEQPGPAGSGPVPGPVSMTKTDAPTADGTDGTDGDDTTGERR
ncbi:SHOCT domain-containing protein [Kitasatospora viridis]|uniref:Putative membrane protein n=1 Tax=Kitasatospora viridis TaxID=281105 RepID=A0A561UCC9_9ACTN|nr:putative membrane protein [Kitasatospora viridis]